MQSVRELQEQACSAYDRRKFCTYDVEFIDGRTIPIIHQTARFWLVKKGRAKITINGTEYQAKTNCFFCILPWSTTMVDEVEEPLTMIKVVFNSDLIISSLRTGYNTTGGALKIYEPIREYPLIHLHEGERERFFDILDIIKDETGVESLFDEGDNLELKALLITNKLMELLIMYNMHLVTSGKQTERALEDNRSDILTYIYSHIAEHPTLSNLSDVFDDSEEKIENDIQELTGMSLSALGNEMRISKTTDLLIYTELALTDIAFLVGYTDASHLVRSFSARTGYTPKQYRQIYSIMGDEPDSDSRERGFEIIAYIGNHFSEDIHAATVAEKFRMSVVEMNKLLIYIVEKNFESFLNYLRINQACRLLLETQESLVDIAVNVGYNTVKTFNRNFVRLRGVTPGEFRKNYHLQKQWTDNTV
jgi:AraC-like DNA-binding protein